MKNIWLVTYREFITQVRKKSFIVLTLLAPLLMIGAGFIISYLISANESSAKVAIIDPSKQFSTAFKSDDENSFSFYEEKELKSLKDSVTSDNSSIDVLVYIPAEKDSSLKNIENGVQVYTNKILSKALISTLENSLNKKIEDKRKSLLNISQQDLDKIGSNVSLKITNLKENKSEDNSGLREVMGLFLMYVVFMFIMIYGTRVMRSIMEEKNNRVVEIIISSVKPFDLMMGKILGTTLVALTQFCIWIGMTMAVLLAGQLFLGAGTASHALNDPNIQQAIMNPEAQTKIKEIIDALLSLNYPLIIFIFLFYFFAGYLFYSSVFAAIGAAVESDTETQQFMFVIIIPLMLGAYGSIGVISNPEGPIAFWLSMIPFTSPMAMVTRIVYGVPSWQIIISMIIMSVSVIGMTYISAKIYRVGILMYGKKTNFKELFKWIKQS